MTTKMKQIRCRQLAPKLAFIRSRKGSFLVESIVAVLVSGLIGAALATMYMQTKRVTNMSQGELIATAIAQECVDHLRVMSYSSVNAQTPSTHYASLTNSGTDVIFSRALLQDPNLDYTNQNNSVVVNAQNSVFHTLNPDTGAEDDSVKIQLETQALGGTPCIGVVVTINWRDTSGSVKSYVMRSFLTENGLGS